MFLIYVAQKSFLRHPGYHLRHYQNKNPYHLPIGKLYLYNYVFAYSEEYIGDNRVIIVSSFWLLPNRNVVV